MTVRNQRHSLINENDALPVTYQDNTTTPLDLLFIKLTGSTTVANNPAINTRSFEATSTTGAVVGYQCIISGANRVTFGLITSIVGSTITIDTPFEYDVAPGDGVIYGSFDMSVDGSVTTQSFVVPNVGASTQGADIEITRIMVQITTATVPQLTDFGDITNGLTNGVVLRRNDGVISNIWNVKQNKDFALLAYDYNVYIGTNPGVGINGFAVRYTFGGPDKHGTVPRLAVGDSLEILIQDDLTGLVDFRIMAQGHLVSLF